MKTGRSRKYYLMEAVLILFNILINLIIFKLLTETPDPYNKDQQEDHKKILDLISDHFSSLIVL